MVIFAGRGAVDPQRGKADIEGNDTEIRGWIELLRYCLSKASHRSFGRTKSPCG